MTLKMETKTFHRVSDADLNDFVSDVYGHDWEFVADEEMGDGESREYVVDGYVPEWAEGQVNRFAETGAYGFLTATLLDDLCRKGLIPPGDYIVATD